MKQVKENNYYKWSVEQGDYVRDEKSTTTYQKKKNLIKKIKLTIIIVFYFIVVSALTYILIAKL